MVERAEGRYEAQDVELGRVYRWRPEQVVVECDCGERTIVTGSETACRCGADYAAVLREGHAASPEDEVLHPWRYAGDREDVGIPY